MDEAKRVPVDLEATVEDEERYEQLLIAESELVDAIEAVYRRGLLNDMVVVLSERKYVDDELTEEIDVADLLIVDDYQSKSELAEGSLVHMPSEETEIMSEASSSMIINAETMNTYNQITALIEDKHVASILDEITNSIIAEEAAQTLTANISSETKVEEVEEINVFEKLVKVRTPVPLPTNVTWVKSIACTQSLEQTLVDFAVFISIETEQTRYQIIKQIIREIDIELLQANRSSDDVLERDFITPTITHKFLQLLREVGYTDPQGVLIDMVKKCDPGFLMQSIRYICDLSSKPSLQEISISQLIKVTPAMKDDFILLRLGRAIMGSFRNRGLSTA